MKIDATPLWEFNNSLLMLTT